MGTPSAWSWVPVPPSITTTSPSASRLKTFCAAPTPAASLRSEHGALALADPQRRARASIAAGPAHVAHWRAPAPRTGSAPGAGAPPLAGRSGPPPPPGGPRPLPPLLKAADLRFFHPPAPQPPDPRGQIV